jgi:hypothetical protein
MIHHVHNMLSPGPDTSVAGNTNKLASRDPLDSFETALSDAASSTLGTFGSDPNAGQVTTTSTTPASSSSSAASSTPANAGDNPFLQAATESWAGVDVPPASTATTASASNVPAPSAATDPTLAFDNAYWAQQPAAVQALQTMQNPEERAEYAEQLASEGYTIDVPIMVWGWDPAIVTSLRQADGYTWVPSALQNPVEMAPGLGSMGNLAAYNPNDPPAGSIAVPPAGSTAV